MIISMAYKGPTDTKGARITINGAAHRMVVPWNYALDTGANYRAALNAFLIEHGVRGEWYGSDTTGGVLWVRANDCYHVAPAGLE